MGRGVVRYIITGILILLWISDNHVIAQVPQRLSYQELVRSAGNVILLNQPVGIRMSILQGSAAGPSVYTETHSVTTNENGLASLQIGGGTPVSGNFTTISWSAGPYYVKSEIDPAGGTTYTLTNTTQLLSVPYTLNAKTINYNNLYNKPAFDGSETKVISGTTVTVGGSGTSGTPYAFTYVTQSVTQAQRNALTPSAGMFVWCNNCGTTGELQVYSGSAWLTMCGAAATPVLPAVTTTAASAITSSTASSGGNVTSDGGGTVSARGVCWRTSSGPTTADSKTTDGTGTGVFVSSLTGLSPATTYYVRAYATNAAGTTYGNEVSFTTPATTPTITTTAISGLGSTTATSGGNITSDGGAAVTARGVCWSTSSNPTTANSKTTDGSGTGSFSSSVTGLSSGVTYYLRAYATNSAGTSYGNEVSFTTLAIPALTTTAISSITGTTASSGGNITSDGGASVTARGVCWSTSPNPTTANSTTSDGSGTGSFTSSLTGLSAGTTYYVRAYATNSVGTAYGNQQSFTTLTFATLTTTAASSVKAFTATSGGNITSNGGTAVTARGVCWSIYPNPTTADQKTSDGSGNGSFVSSLTGLYPLTTFYVRAYATNSAGTAYGNQISFTTPDIAIGDAFQGGIVAYILQPGDPGYVAGRTDGLIATTGDVLGSYTWGCRGTDLGGNPTAERDYIGGGSENSIEIISNCLTAGIAARVCESLVTGGYDDWFLPSQDEMSALYASKNVVGSYVSNTYWTSTEYRDPSDPGNDTWPKNYAVTMSFLSGFPSIGLKDAGYGIRPIRRFLKVGDMYKGGIIAYIFKPGDADYVPGQTHGLIATTFDLAASQTWYNGSNTVTSAIETAIGAGSANTTTIVASQGVGTYAARTCDVSADGGYTDWYLPSKDELNQLYINRTLIGGFSAASYWSSSETSSSQAWSQNFSGGAQNGTAAKSSTYRVRAVRKF